MKTSQIISLASLVLGSQALVAAPKDASYAKRQAGICMLGVNSPCNGDAWYKNGLDGKDWSDRRKKLFGNFKASEEKRSAEAAPVEEEKRDAKPAVYGICMIGVDSPCNGDAWDKNGLDGKGWSDHRKKLFGDFRASEEKRDAEPEPVPAPAPAPIAVEQEKREAEPQDIGICVIGVDSPCNGDAWDKNGKDGKDWNDHRRRLFGNFKSSEEKREA
ncbi:hypothetical protein Slin14017_G082600 [Septoria linicola]|nr:hypothetical protein Slin14017_G082600 [Septoria linicola]